MTTRISKEVWNKEYSSGQWDYLKFPSERARYAIIGMYCNYFAKKGPILEIGCGEGMLLEFLNPILAKDYLGIDISKEAIRKAKREKKTGSFLCIDAERFKPEKHFFGLVLSEVLYYVDAEKLLKKCLHYLKKGGYVFISMYRHKYDKSIWKNIKPFYEFVDGIKIKGKSKGRYVTWRIEIGKKK